MKVILRPQPKLVLRLCPFPPPVDHIIAIVVVKGVDRLREVGPIVVDAFEGLVEVEVECFCVSLFAAAVERCRALPSEVASSTFAWLPPPT